MFNTVLPYFLSINHHIHIPCIFRKMSLFLSLQVFFVGLKKEKNRKDNCASRMSVHPEF